MNVRQKELLANWKELLLKAVNEARAINEQEPYTVEFNTESFLTDYALPRGIGEYARKRYFKDFITQYIFVKISEDKFKLGTPKTVCSMLEKFGFYIPKEMKPKELKLETKE